MRITQDGPGYSWLKKPANPRKAHQTSGVKCLNFSNQHWPTQVNLAARPWGEWAQISMSQTIKVPLYLILVGKPSYWQSLRTQKMRFAGSKNLWRKRLFQSLEKRSIDRLNLPETLKIVDLRLKRQSILRLTNKLFKTTTRSSCWDKISTIPKEDLTTWQNIKSQLCKFMRQSKLTHTVNIYHLIHHGPTNLPINSNKIPKCMGTLSETILSQDIASLSIAEDTMYHHLPLRFKLIANQGRFMWKERTL